MIPRVHLQTHALASWLLTEAGPASMTRRDRILVLAAGLAPDVDALSLLGGITAYQKWHHVLFHNVVGAAVTTIALLVLASWALAVRCDRTIVQAFSPRMDARVVEILKRWWPV